MSKQRIINTKFWIDDYSANLDPIEKLLFLYFLTNPYTEICGIYEIPLKHIALETGIDREMVLKIIARFEKDKKVFYRKGWVAIQNFAKHQANNPSVSKGVERGLNAIPISVLDELVQSGYSLVQPALLKLKLKLKLKPMDTEQSSEPLVKKTRKKKVEDDTPFSYEEYLKEMRKSEDARMRLIAVYFTRRGLTFSSKGEIGVAIKRHLRAATDVTKFEKDKVNNALNYCKDKYNDIDWTLDTVKKVLTGANL